MHISLRCGNAGEPQIGSGTCAFALIPALLLRGLPSDKPIWKFLCVHVCIYLQQQQQESVTLQLCKRATCQSNWKLVLDKINAPALLSNSNRQSDNLIKW